jgi:hypothetical protein
VPCGPGASLDNEGESLSALTRDFTSECFIEELPRLVERGRPWSDAGLRPESSSPALTDHTCNLLEVLPFNFDHDLIPPPRHLCSPSSATSEAASVLTWTVWHGSRRRRRHRRRTGDGLPISVH